METQLRSEINVTPLVDVCLVLLIIFMVVTPMLKRADVKLPETLKPQALAEKASQLTVLIQADGATFVERRQVAGGNLAEALSRTNARGRKQDVVIQADRRLRYEQVRRIMSLVSAAGWSRVGLITEKRKGGGPA